MLERRMRNAGHEVTGEAEVRLKAGFSEGVGRRIHPRQSVDRHIFLPTPHVIHAVDSNVFRTHSSSGPPTKMSSSPIKSSFNKDTLTP